MHHVILSMPFLILAMCASLKAAVKVRLWIKVMIVLFLVLNISLFVQLPTLSYEKRNHHSNQIRFNEYLNKYSNTHVFICVDWGMYFIKSLFGNSDQSVIEIRELKYEAHIERVKQILRKTGRKAIFIRTSATHSDWNSIRQHFPGLTRLVPEFETGLWEAWYQR